MLMRLYLIAAVLGNQVMWKGTAQTEVQGNISQEIKDYASIMIAALKDKKLI
jgi:hypothetical protein